MKTEEKRDEETVVIAIALLGFVPVAVIGLILYGFTSVLTARAEGPLDIVLWTAFAVLLAGLVVGPLGYLYRHRRA